jgi:uncharacterized protein YndB with AHSA1/START domain
LSDQAAIIQLASDNSCLILTAAFPQFSPKGLFTHFTQPDLLQLWWPPQATIEPGLAGTVHLSWLDIDWHLRGVFTKFEPFTRLGFTWRWDHEPALPTRQVDLLMEAVGASSRLTITHGAYDESQRDQDDRQSHLDGWIYFLGQLLALT